MSYIVITRLLIASQQYFKPIVDHDTFPVVNWPIQSVHCYVGGMAGQLSIPVNDETSAKNFQGIHSLPQTYRGTQSITSYQSVLFFVPEKYAGADSEKISGCSKAVKTSCQLE